MTDTVSSPNGPARTRIDINLGERSYPILIGEELLDEAGAHLAPLLPRKRTVIVTDENVAELHLQRLLDSCAGAGIEAEPVVLPAGEASKSFPHLEWLAGQLLELGIERKDAVVALGGGVIGDLVGFAAAILRRGCPFVQIPTTLLSQVDSSVGGKTGINTPQGKNLIGAFHQPKLVLIDTDIIDTLPRRELLAGYAEIVKYGLINDAGFFAWLEENGKDVLAGDPVKRAHAIAVSCRAKAAVVEADEFETKGTRALLNLGHTFGHALEAEKGYSGDLLHGEGVALGMVLAFELSVEMGLCPPEDLERVRRHLDSVGLPTTLKQVGLDGMGETLVAHMAQDKKMEAGRLTFILARGIGQSYLERGVDMEQVKALLNRPSA
ncbi:3-dehydroquinate synthase [Pedomonas sp. V897]|uniref:3-dehydroquinate synthase n=1 Tax=Pedomonas sp. V897 TaxID=3446482 RepID=UPI003EE00967